MDSYIEMNQLFLSTLKCGEPVLPGNCRTHVRTVLRLNLNMKFTWKP